MVSNCLPALDESPETERLACEVLMSPDSSDDVCVGLIHDDSETHYHLDEHKAHKEELTKDLIAIITSFSAKLYGARSHKNKRLISEVKNVIYSENTIEPNIRAGEATG